MTKIIFLFFLIGSTAVGCGGETPKDTSGHETLDTLSVVEKPIPTIHNFGYQLEQPDLTFKLHKDLQEISGLGINEKGDRLYAIQDEDGLIFILDAKTGEIIKKEKFHKDGDYEGIELVGDIIYVIKSTGTIYQVTNFGETNQQMKKFNSFLSRENDVEGLGYYPKKNCLLLACKGIPATGESFQEIRYKKAVYQFDLATNTLLPDPIYTVKLNDIRQYLDQHQSLKEYEKLVEFFSTGKENLTFNPSAIAVHPLTGNIYLTSSSGKVLLVLSDTGKVIHVEKLDKDVHVQPEGLAFAKDGTLYVSNEGKGGKARIHKFKYQK